MSLIGQPTRLLGYAAYGPAQTARIENSAYGADLSHTKLHSISLSTFPELHSKERRPEGDSRFLRRFSGVLASGTLAGVGGGRSAESAAALSSRVYSYIYRRVRVSVEPVMAAAAFVLLSAVGGGWGGGFGHVVGESAAPSSGEALWRIKDELGLSGPLVSFPDPGGFFLCPSLGSVDVDACFSGGGLWRFGYHLGRSGRCVDPSFSGVVFRSHLL